MRVLLDTNILIHREAASIVREDIGTMFYWLDKLSHVKCIHPVSIEEIKKHQDERVRTTFLAKLQSYHVLQTLAALGPAVQEVGKGDASENDRNDTLLVNELFSDRVDLLISEDRGVHRKASLLGVADRTFTIDDFLEKVTAENPGLVDYKVLSVRKNLLGNVDVRHPFFDSFREDYGGVAFDKWFSRKSDEPGYLCVEREAIVAFLYLKIEIPGEDYSDI